MNTSEYAARGLNASGEFLKMTVADMTDAELLTRPCPSANHPLWQLGHLCSAERGISEQIKPGSMPELPAGFKERFENKKTNDVDDISKLATKQELLDLFTKLRAATIAMVTTMSPADFDQPAPESFKRMCQTVGDVVNLQVTHVMMHVGQFQVARRKVGKPVLF
jgi:hypothetical protein